jgi:hypothetical protein
LAFRLFGEYVWLWLALFASLIFYVPLAFWKRGNITLSSKQWWKFYIHRRSNPPPESDLDGIDIKELAQRKLAYDLLAYVQSNARASFVLIFFQVSSNICRDSLTAVHHTLEDIR